MPSLNLSRQTIVRTLWIGLLVAGITAGCQPPDTPEARKQRADQIVQQAMADASVPGAALAVLRNGTLVHRAQFGNANVRTGRTVTDSTLFQLASTSKIVAGTVVMTLVDEARLALDDSVHTHLPSLPDAWRGVTIRGAMSHTSGLPNVLNSRTGDLLGGESVEEAFRAAQHKPLGDTATTTWDYNQTGYEIVRRIIEAVTGSPYEEVARERVFAPASMPRTHFAGRREAVGVDTTHVATGYDENGQRVDFEEVYATYISTAAGLYSSTAELSAFIRALTDGTLLSDSARTAMWTPVPFETSTIDAVTGYGIGWTVDDQQGHKRVWHSGGGKAVLMHFPGEALTVIYLTNRTGHDVLTPAQDIANLYLNTSLRGAQGGSASGT